MKQNKTAKASSFEPIYFDGYCPESLLKGEKVVMLLNEDDFFESPVTGLQITCFPPYAAILKWRGKGRFKLHRYEAPDYYRGLMLTKASTEKNMEIFPDENEILHDSFDLEQHLQLVCASYEEYLKSQENKEAEAFKRQKEHLESIANEEWENLIELYKMVEKEGLNSEAFNQLHQMLYDLEIIFDFDWVNNSYSKKLFEDETINFCSSDLIELSIYLALIFQSERFPHTGVSKCFGNGILAELFIRLEEIMCDES